MHAIEESLRNLNMATTPQVPSKSTEQNYGAFKMDGRPRVVGQIESQNTLVGEFLTTGLDDGGNINVHKGETEPFGDYLTDILALDGEPEPEADEACETWSPAIASDLVGTDEPNEDDPLLYLSPDLHLLELWDDDTRARMFKTCPLFREYVDFHTAHMLGRRREYYTWTDYQLLYAPTEWRERLEETLAGWYFKPKPCALRGPRSHPIFTALRDPAANLTHAEREHMEGIIDRIRERGRAMRIPERHGAPRRRAAVPAEFPFAVTDIASHDLEPVLPQLGVSDVIIDYGFDKDVIIDYEPQEEDPNLLLGPNRDFTGAQEPEQIQVNALDHDMPHATASGAAAQRLTSCIVCKL
ncbi:hypothetical protein HDU96_000632 [Phlyctochytrium bullatum]|nr:hypothetical protein HDU96_000632 [Phlyctochytrium bullatum]